MEAINTDAYTQGMERAERLAEAAASAVGLCARRPAPFALCGVCWQPADCLYAVGHAFVCGGCVHHATRAAHAAGARPSRACPGPA